MGQQDNKTEDPGPLSEDERELVNYFRRCSPRRQEVVKRFAAKLAALEWPLGISHQVITNVFPFKRRKDD